MKAVSNIIFIVTFYCLILAPHIFAQAPIPIKSGSDPIERLSGAIRYQTVSSIKEENFKYEEFIAFHDYLEQVFPLTHQHLQKEIINEHSLLYTWRGKSNTLKPILISAHMDVVPVETVSREEWQETPFSGRVKGGYIWGRGTMDDKYRVMAILESVEQLLRLNYTPQRTIYIAFGHDEEVGGKEGAGKIAAYLHAQNITLEAVFDEGLAIADKIIPSIDEPIALVGTAAKGNLNVRLTVEGKGGHSSVPPADTPIDILSRAISNLHAQPFKARMTDTSFETVNTLANALGGKYKFALRHYGLFKGRVLKMLAEDEATDALIRTKMSPTVIQSGDKSNVLPRLASAIINVRILNGEDKLSVMQHMQKAINDDRVKLEAFGEYSPPSPVTKTDTWVYEALSKSIKETYDDILIVPALFPGTTDSKHYEKLTPNIFRFAPQVVNRKSAKLIHNVDERLAVDVYFNCIAFYKSLIQNTSGLHRMEFVIGAN